MDAKVYLKTFSKKLEKAKAKFFREKIKEAAKIDPVAAEALKNLQNYMTGGKNVRAALVILGYRIAGGKDLKAILPAALAVELMHNSLIIHDDFVDNDTVRRGKPTIHKIYEVGKSEHYGAAMAIIVGDVGIFLANKLLAEANFPKDKVAQAAIAFNKLLLNTGYGELMDIDFDYKKKITWDDVLKVRIYKTAHYTFVMPLIVGATLGGGNVKLLALLKKYGEPVGLAFQLRDDVLGVFGDSGETGKSSESDIVEGKKTLLYLKALELAGALARKFLQKWYGGGRNKARLTARQVSRIKEIIKASGALAYSDRAAADFVAQGKKFIPKVTKNRDLVQILSSLADYMIQRDK